MSRRSTVEVDITPTMAATWLAQNRTNRPIRKDTVRRYAADMTAGRWEVTHEGIAFGTDGTLYDGQHRLSAIVASGMTVRMQVTRGMTPQQRLCMGQPIPRNTGDTFSIVYGIDHGKERVAIARIIVLITEGAANSKTNGEMWGILSAYEPELTWAIGATIGNELRFAPIAGALAFAHRLNPEMVSDFAERGRAGEGLSKGEPVHTWRERVMKKPRTGSHGSTPRAEVAMKTLRAIQAHIKGERLLKIYVPEERQDLVSFFSVAYQAPKARGK